MLLPAVKVPDPVGTSPFHSALPFAGTALSDPPLSVVHFAVSGSSPDRPASSDRPSELLDLLCPGLIAGALPSRGSEPASPGRTLCRLPARTESENRRTLRSVVEGRRHAAELIVRSLEHEGVRYV